MLRWFGDLWLWANATDPRTWVVHAVIAAVITVFLGPVVAIFYYTLREVEQVWNFYSAGEELHPIDHVMDVLSPAFAAGLIWLLFFLL